MMLKGMGVPDLAPINAVFVAFKAITIKVQTIDFNESIVSDESCERITKSAEP